MKVNITNSVKRKRQVNSEDKSHLNPSETIPDERNKEICLNCPYKDCKGNCELIRGDK